LGCQLTYIWTVIVSNGKMMFADKMVPSHILTSSLSHIAWCRLWKI